jgi:hypothetical protein
MPSSVFCCNRIPETKSLVMNRISLGSWFMRLWYLRAWGIWWGPLCCVIRWKKGKWV